VTIAGRKVSAWSPGQPIQNKAHTFVLEPVGYCGDRHGILLCLKLRATPPRGRQQAGQQFGTVRDRLHESSHPAADRVDAAA